MAKDKIDEAKNARFMDVVQWLIDNGEAENQGDLTIKAGFGPNIISRIKNNHNNVSEDTIRALCEKFKDVNIDYIRGKSEYMSRYEAASAKLDDALNDKSKQQQPEVPDYVQRLCEESARLATRNEMLERQCENLIAELRESKDKNDAFLVELKASQKFHDTLVADLRISRTQNDTLIAELRETRKQNAVLASELSDAKSKLDDALLSIEGMKGQLSMILSHFKTNEYNDLGTLRVNDEGEPVIMIQVPNVTDVTHKTKAKKHDAPDGYIKGNVRVITNEMVYKALKAFENDKKQ